MSPFQPISATVNIDVSSSSQTVAIDVDGGTSTVRVMNNGTATAWINFGGSTITAALASAVPVGPGVTEVYTVPAPASGLYVAAIAAAATGKIYFTPGGGI
jgi:hypothetical protein